MRLEEFVTIGVPYQENFGDRILIFHESDWYLTDNALREEHGLPKRVTHHGRWTVNEAVEEFSKIYGD